MVPSANNLSWRNMAAWSRAEMSANTLISNVKVRLPALDASNDQLEKSNIAALLYLFTLLYDAQRRSAAPDGPFL